VSHSQSFATWRIEFFAFLFAFIRVFRGLNQYPLKGSDTGTNPWIKSYDNPEYATIPIGSSDFEAGAKPVDDKVQNPYLNADHAGTPENFKSYVIGGATGGGGSNYTGGYSGTVSVRCPR
jgi:hypothetical protein